jgi:hypothetical protein
MDKFKKKTPKTALKELVENKENQQTQIQSLKQALMTVYQKLYQVDNAAQTSQRVANALDLRTRAMMVLLGKVGITEQQIKDQVEELQVEQFNRDSKEDDKKRGLVEADGPADNGHFATTTIRLYKDGTEIESERIVRSKIELGKAELLPEIDAAIVGMSVGETKQFPLELQGRSDSAELTLLSIKKKSETPELSSES